MTLIRRIEKLEAVAPVPEGVPTGIVRYSPPADRDNWFGDLLRELGWNSRALVIVDGNPPATATPEVLVPPLAEDHLSWDQIGQCGLAGRTPGRWWVGIAGGPNPIAYPMPHGLERFMTSLRADLRRERDGHSGEL